MRGDWDQTSGIFGHILKILIPFRRCKLSMLLKNKQLLKTKKELNNFFFSFEYFWKGMPRKT